MTARVDVLIQPVCLRFRLHEDEMVYLMGASPEMQLDGMERMLGVDPSSQTLFDANLGFLPVATTTLIRGEKTILVDPGNHHVGFYGMLARSLGRFELELGDVDVVVCTHCHHDHMASVAMLAGRPLVLGAGESEFAAGIYGAAFVDAQLSAMETVLEVPAGGELELGDGVAVVATPGHTPGHVSVLVDRGIERIVVAGDVTMTRAEYEEGLFSHWYGPEQLEQLQASVARLRAFDPSLVFPGHDRGFRPRDHA
jgi:N-acyl homoserine lactone hydrolase